MTEVLYEKKYPRKEVDYPAEPIEKKPLTEEQKKEFNRFLEELETSVVLVLLPHRQEGANRFIKAAIGVSKLYELDLRLTRHDSHISATISFDDGGCMSALKPLLAMGDDFAFFSTVNDRDHTISIDYFTHAVYRHEHLIAPIEWDFDE